MRVRFLDRLRMPSHSLSFLPDLLFFECPDVFFPSRQATERPLKLLAH
jgi:hypothetical protein